MLSLILPFLPSFPCGSISQRAESYQEAAGFPGVILGCPGCPEQGSELDSMILGGPFQLGMFCDPAAQTAVPCLLQGKDGNCTELVLS